MKMSKQAVKLRELSDAELQAKLRELQRQLFTVRFAVATGQQDNTALLTQTKREIARVKTIMRERQLGIRRK
ncbi:MAG: 50S ribosomal protein L29 [Candidatus Bipolaricaulota bacterium]|nr:50S ribosomal protein L29 [Candidatus Bipolaricaulota bacterium]MCS7275066.1 50S ribosomal protein L29 [Candidatus Bipolaricaulota bacterium]MDW8110394.1 50S ribosomal protein L29 [Candidatus Bipolaricaulota bacterium]MDW8329535.1 50S ribosomal protein L29 [Candidatus Bipolaricaulota bacterium]